MNNNFNVFIVSCLFLSFASHGQEPAGFFDPIYLGDTTYLYDQSSMDRASEAELEAEFERRKRHLYTEHAWQKSKYYVAGAIGAILPAYWLLPKAKNLNHIGAGAGFGGSVMLFGLFGNMMYAFTQSVVNEISDTCSIWSKAWFRREADALHQDERSYVRQKPKMPPNLQHSKRPTPYPTSESPVNPVSVIKSVLKMPFESKSLVFNSTALEERLTGYSKEGVATMKRFALRHYMADKGTVFKKSFVYFYGKPGTGKTRAAKLIGEALDAPVVTISVGEIGDMSDIYGDSKRPGFLARALLQANALGTGGKNVLIVLDDADRLLNRKETDESVKLLVAFLHLIEPETKSYYDNYFETDIDISQINGILTGNTVFADSALASRAHMVDFSEVGAEYKKFVVVNEIIPQILKRYQDSDMALAIDSHDNDQINQLIQDDKDPGFRTITFQVEEYLAGKALDAMAESLDFQPKVESAKISSSVAD